MCNSTHGMGLFLWRVFLWVANFRFTVDCIQMWMEKDLRTFIVTYFTIHLASLIFSLYTYKVWPLMIHALAWVTVEALKKLMLYSIKPAITCLVGKTESVPFERWLPRPLARLYRNLFDAWSRSIPFTEHVKKSGERNRFNEEQYLAKSSSMNFSCWSGSMQLILWETDSRVSNDSMVIEAELLDWLLPSGSSLESPPVDPSGELVGACAVFDDWSSVPPDS